MKRSWMIAWVMAAGLAALGACKKEGGAAGVAAMLPADVASRVSKDVLTFAEVVPAGVQAFGYVDLGKPLRELSGNLRAFYPDMFEDLLEMTKRRWGADVAKLRGAGVVALQDEVVMLALLPDAPPMNLPAKIAVAKLGSLTAIGTADAVAAMVAAHKQQKPLYQAEPKWMKQALMQAAGKPAFFSASAAQLANRGKRRPRPLPPQLENVEQVTFAVGGDGVAATIACKPGTAAAQRAIIEGGLGLLRARVEAVRSTLPTDGFGPLGASLLSRYSDALFQSVKLDASGDDVAVALAWHMMDLPTPTPPPPLSERVIAKDEWLVAQFQLGAPVLDLAVAFTDVLGAKIDRAAVVRELTAELGKATGIAGANPTSVIVSGGGETFYASLHNAPVTLDPDPQRVLDGKAAAITQPWGFVLTKPEDDANLLVDAAAPPPPLPLLASSKLAKRTDVVMRIFVDATRLPAKAQPIPFPLQSVEFSATATNFTAEVVALPGQAGELAKTISGFLESYTGPVDQMYAGRKSAPVALELIAIMQHSQAKMVREVLTPKVDGDRLLFSRDFPAVSMRMMTGAAIVGGLAAVAIPSFMRYQQRSQNVYDQLHQAQPDAPEAPADDAP